MNPDNFRIGQKVYHMKVYDGREQLTVVGIRATELELEGDYSGGTHNVCQKDWLPIEGVRYRKQRTANEEVVFQLDVDQSRKTVLAGGVPNIPQQYNNIIQSAFHFGEMEKRIIIFTSKGLIRSFVCDENWNLYPTPFGECLLSLSDTTAEGYHRRLRNEIHKPEYFVPEHSTPLN